MKVVIDTNALLIPFEFGLDPYSGVRDLVPKAELVTLEECVSELKKIKPNSWESVMSLGLQKGLKIVSSGFNEKVSEEKSSAKLSVDDRIVNFASIEKCLVLTQDIGLRRKLLVKGVRVILMRNKKTFALMG